MSKIIRHTNDAPSVFIGKRQRDAQAEALAERQLAELFPPVNLLTAPDGARLIPIEEVNKIANLHSRRVDESRRSGYDDGYAKGYGDGLEKGREEARNVLNDLNQAITDAVDQRQNILEEARKKILDLVVQISRKVTYDAVDIDREATVDMISAVIDRLVDRSHLKIKVHPDHLPLVEQHRDRFLVGSAAIKELGIEADPRVRYGGCFIETPSGDIDARLDSQLDVIDEAIRTAEDSQ